ncbi:hypothetical protein ACOSQ4_026024 [Xanthoceras sorbifolium]
MAADDPEHLPAGWTLQLKVQKTGRIVRYYMNLGTGKRFFCKDDLLQYVRMESTRCNKPQPTSARSKRRSEYSDIKHIPKENECYKWLPDGWVMELKTRKSGSKIGRPYKIFIDPSTGCKFLSKPEVFRYLESVKQKKCASKQERTGTHSSSKAAVISTVNDLPPGWIKETRTRKTAFGSKKDPYYMDPVSGYIFRSKRDVLRYLETGEISKYAFKQAKNDIGDEALTSTATKRQKLKQTVTRRQLFEGKASLNVCSTALPEAEAFNKRRSKRLSAEINPDGPPTAEVFQEKMMIRKGTGTKEVTSLSCSSLPKSRDSKRYQGKRILAENLMVSTPTNSLQGQNSLEREMECSYRKSMNNSSKSKNKKKLNLPRRSSKRLAGHEPELVVNWDSTKCSLKSATSKSCKSEAIPAGGLMSDGLADKASEQLKAGPVKEHANCMSTEQNLQSHGEPSNKIKACNNLAIPGDQLQNHESVKPDDGKSEPCPLFSFGSSYLDPCLEFAFRTLTGEIPVDGISDNRPVSTPAVDVLRDKILPETDIGKDRNRKTQINSIKSKNKQELNLPHRSSKRLSGLEPELVSNLIFSEQSCGNVTRNSNRPEASTGLADVVSQQLGVGHETGLAHHDSTGIISQSHVELSNKSKRDLDAQTIFEEQPQKLENEKMDTSNKSKMDLEAQTIFEGQPQKLGNEKMDTGKLEDQPQKLETEKINNENAESQFFSFGDSWSDPCLEFAYKTLTGAIPVEDNFAIQDYIQHQLASASIQNDGASGLPDLGLPSSFENDALFQFDAQEKQPVSQQNFSVNQSLLPSGNGSSPNCSSIASQQSSLEGSKGFHGKVKS